MNSSVLWGLRKSLWVRGESIEIFVDKFLSRKLPFLSQISDFASDAYVTIFDFLSKSFCPTVPNNFLGEPFSVSSISGIGNILDKLGGTSGSFV